MCRSLANSFQPLVQLVFFSHMSLSLSMLSNRVSPHQIPKIYGIAIFLEDLGKIGFCRDLRCDSKDNPSASYTLIEYFLH